MDVHIPDWLGAGPSGMRNFIPVRYGTVFLQNPGIPVFFGTVLAIYSIPGFFGNCSILFVFSLLLPLVINLLGLLHIHKLPKVRHHNKHYHQWGKVKQLQPM